VEDLSFQEIENRRRSALSIVDDVLRSRGVQASEGVVFKPKRRYIAHLMHAENLPRKVALREWNKAKKNKEIHHRINKAGNLCLPLEVDYVVLATETLVQWRKKQKINRHTADANEQDLTDQIRGYTPSKLEDGDLNSIEGGALAANGSAVLAIAEDAIPDTGAQAPKGHVKLVDVKADLAELRPSKDNLFFEAATTCDTFINQAKNVFRDDISTNTFVQSLKTCYLYAKTCH
jgi:hypothetical protein